MEGVEKIHVGDLQVSIDFIPKIVEFDTILISDSKAHKKTTEKKELRKVESKKIVKIYKISLQSASWGGHDKK